MKNVIFWTIVVAVLLSNQAFAGEKIKLIKSGEIYDLLHEACAQLEMETCPRLYKNQNIEAIAQAGVLKSGKSVIIVNPSKFRSSTKTIVKKRMLLAHELTHVIVKEETGRNSRHHGAQYKQTCKEITATLNLSLTACKSSM